MGECELEAMGARAHTTVAGFVNTNFIRTASREENFSVFFCAMLLLPYAALALAVGGWMRFHFFVHFLFQLFDSFTYFLPLLFHPIYLAESLSLLWQGFFSVPFGSN